MNTDKQRAAEQVRADYQRSKEKAPGRFLHFTKPEDWKQHQQQVAEAQKQGAPF